MAAVPIAELGIYFIDEQGGLSGWSNGMLGGEYIDATIAGRVEVNPDCSGVIRFSVTPWGQTTPLPVEGIIRTIVLDNGNAMRGMAVAGVLGKPVGMESHRRINRNASGGQKCSMGTVRGTYAVGADLGTGVGLMTVAGQTQPATIVVSGVGVIAIDSGGGVTGGFTQLPNGQLLEKEVLNSSLEVYEDCTGYFSLRTRPKGTSGTPSGPATLEKLIVLDNGEEIWTLTISAPGAVKPVTPGSWKRISKDVGPVAW